MSDLVLKKDDIKLVLEMLGTSGKYSALKKKCERALKPIKTSSAKGKGRNLQHWVCERISEITGIPYNQQSDSCLIHSREMGQAGVDIVLRGGADTMFPFAVECKSVENFSLYSSVDQAVKNERPQTYWLLVHKKKNRNPIAIMDWNTFQYFYSMLLKKF